MAMGYNIPGNGPETNDPVVLETDVEDVAPGFYQTGLYFKNGAWLSIKDKSLVLQGDHAISIGGEHTLYLLEKAVPLSSIRISAISKTESDLLKIKDVLNNVIVNYNLYSSHDLQNWSLHPVQNKSLVGNQLCFDVGYLTVLPPQFFQVFGPE